MVTESGYPLEIEISNLLDKDYRVYNTRYYWDKEIDSGRTIDIFAISYSPNQTLFDQIIPFSSIAIECKKSNTHHWVFFTRPNRIDEIFKGNAISGQCKSSIPNVISGGSSMDDWIRSVPIFPNLHYSSYKEIAVAYHEFKKQKRQNHSSKSRDEIFEAIIQLVKFVCYQMHEVLNDFSKRSSRLHSDLIAIIFPTIVFDGELFEAFYKSGELALEKRKHIPMLFDFRCPYCHNIETFTIDIVQSTFLREYLWLLKNDNKKMETELLEWQDGIAEGAKKEREMAKKFANRKRGI
jgi:hypothetical protein